MKRTRIDVHGSLLSGNEASARHNRAHFLAAGVPAINLMGSPGSGKTALLEATARWSDGRVKLAAVSGDLATANDADRLKRAGIPSEAITTGNACHLDADMVHAALDRVPWRDADLFVIENVGNLVCPAVYDLGQMASVVCLAVTEGEDKPLKYPPMFMKADLVVLTKVDLLPHLPGYSVAAVEDALSKVMPAPKMIRFSSVTGEGVEAWIAWLDAMRESIAIEIPAPPEEVVA